VAKVISTELRIPHKTIEDKKIYEDKLDKALKDKGYTTRLEFIRESIRNLIDKG